MTRSKFLRALRISATVAAIILIVSYAIWRSLPYARGPIIDVFEPVDGATIATSTVTVIGRAERINSLTLNGHALSVDQEDNFKETVVVFPGMNIISIYATDQFGRRVSEEIRIFGSYSAPR